MHQRDLLVLLERLIGIKSTAHNPTALSKIISLAEEYLAIPDLESRSFTHNGKHNLLIFPAGTKNMAFDVILNAHLDVVPAHDRMFKLTTKDGKAHGRGTVDMKGAAAVMMMLYRDLAQNGQLGSVALSLVTDEEVGGHNGVKVLLEQEKVTSKLFLAGEPTNLGICYQQKGLLWLELIEKGKATHGSTPWSGQNANISLAQKIAAFYANHEQPKDKDDWKTSYNLSIMHGGGEAKNVVADKAVAYMDIRRIQSENTENIVRDVQETFKNTEINIVLDEPCLDADPDSAYIRSLAQSIEKIANQDVKLTRETFGSDSRFYSAAGTPAINFGPVGSGMHGDEEWVDIESLGTYYMILKDFLTR